MHDDMSNIFRALEETHSERKAFEDAFWESANDVFGVVSIDYKSLREAIDMLSHPDDPDRFFQYLLDETGEAASANLRNYADEFLKLAHSLFAAAELCDGRRAFGKEPFHFIDSDALQVGCFAKCDGHIVVRSGGRCGAAPAGREPSEVTAIKVLRTFSKYGTTDPV
ncbi:hypothetical protein [Paragemmobacter straminiformis]|uniref:Uncharacterized protein n=1 Tax=Paragemmobacter straminiformis TaxID=2045119 RepID=A0A842I3Q2_9RHOB|nr:hypothetical protein [Gemmobacter straminiformis]MBC2834073.1 hypothetical protein [Gemmobacter straminiformis]